MVVPGPRICTGRFTLADWDSEADESSRALLLLVSDGRRAEPDSVSPIDRWTRRMRDRPEDIDCCDDDAGGGSRFAEGDADVDARLSPS